MDADGVTISFDSSSEGPSVATLSYAGPSTMFQLFIRMPIVRKFTVTKAPDKKSYLAGEKLDLSGLVLTAEYETGEKRIWEDIPEVDYRVKQGDTVYPLNISGISVPIYIKVAAANITGIRMGKPPDKLEYLERKDHFSAGGGSIFRIFDSGVEEELPLPQESVRGFSNLNPGTQTLTVQIGRYTTQFDVTIMLRDKNLIRPV